jgi:hypothetical protein
MGGQSKRMQRHRQDASVRRAFLIKDIELVDENSVEIFSTSTLIQKNRKIADFEGIGQRDERTVAGYHRIRLLVITPIGNIFETSLCQKVECVMAFGECRA